jgi:hypothetical protein
MRSYAMNKVRTPTAASPTQKVTAEVIGQLKNIRALWLAVYNDPNHTLAELSVEFYEKVGELLEGKSLQQLTYYNINKERVLRHAEDF